MKILVICRSPWRDDNNIGNSYTNIFGNLDDEIELANIYLKEGEPKNNIVKNYFQITEKRLIKNLLNKKNKTGIEFKSAVCAVNFNNKEKKIYDKLRFLRFQLLFMFREFIWIIGKWKSNELNSFIDDFNPDIIFAPLQDSRYLNNIILYVKRYTNKPLVTYSWDDVFTLKQISMSPYYWLNRFLQRVKIRQVVSNCELTYAISEKQAYEYSKIFDKQFKVLYKGYNFTKEKDSKDKLNKPLIFTFTGNISSGRWKTLNKISVYLNKINKHEVLAQLHIYTLSPISKKVEKKLNLSNTVFLHGAVTNEEVNFIQAGSDVLIHVESLKIKEMLVTRLSFSTKIVDYFFKRKCIFAVGNKNSASIEYLLKNDAAIVVNHKNQIFNRLNELIENKDLISLYAKKSWECGEKNHQITNIQKNLLSDFRGLIKEGKNESYTN